MREIKVTKERQQWMSENGFNPDEVTTWRLMWQRLKYHASTRDLECTLSFEEYLTLAKNAGLYDPKLIGRNKGNYQLGRYGDKGNYTVNNCRFILKEINRKEMTENGGDKAMAESLRGRTKETHSGNKTQSEKLSKNFRLISPNGVVFLGTNLKEFCKAHNLNRGNMSSVCRGEMKSYKGWTGEYLEINEGTTE